MPSKAYEKRQFIFANFASQVERNVLDVSFHVSQYRNIIQDLRSEIARLREKMAEDRPPSVTRPAGGQQAKHLREQIVSTFRDQMKLRSAHVGTVL